MKKILIIVLFFVVIFGVLAYFLFNQNVTNLTKTPLPETKDTDTTDVSVKSIDFSKVNQEFLFSTEIPKELEVEYIPQLRVINIYNPNLAGQNNIEKSQIYITFFKADKFLTLSTVEITQRDEMIVNGHDAILYEITKKPGLPNFSGQPSWRNFKHKALDVRLTASSPSTFYSFAYNPNLPEKVFNNFIDSLVFYTEK